MNIYTLVAFIADDTLLSFVCVCMYIPVRL